MLLHNYPILDMIGNLAVGFILGILFTTLNRRSEEKSRILRELKNQVEELRQVSRDYWASQPEQNNDSNREAEINYIFKLLPEKFEDAERVYGKTRFELDISGPILTANLIVTGDDFASPNRGHGLARAEKSSNAFLKIISNLDGEISKIRSQNPLRWLDRS